MKNLIFFFVYFMKTSVIFFFFFFFSKAFFEKVTNKIYNWYKNKYQAMNFKSFHLFVEK